MVDPKAGKFINSLVKSLQMLCHGYMDFKDNIEIIGHIYLRIDNSQKFDYIVNEQVSRQGDDSTFFQSNSYHSQPPAKAVREKDRPASENIDDDAVTNHIRLDDAAVSGSRVQIDLSGPVPVTRHSELSPGRRFSTSSNASDADHHTSYGRDSHRHSFDEEAAKTLSPEDHPHNHSSLSSARDRDVCERPASSSSERTEINTIFQVKVAEKSRQHESDGLHEFDGTVIVKAEPDEGNHDCVMEEEGTQNQGREMQRIPSVASVLPPAHQSALVANSAHAGHAMFAATLGHSGMFDTSMPTQDSNLSAKTVRQGYVHEAFMQQILSAQQQTHLAHAGSGLQSFPATVQSSKNSTGDFLLPKSAHIQKFEQSASASTASLPGTFANSQKPASAKMPSSYSQNFITFNDDFKLFENNSSSSAEETSLSIDFSITQNSQQLPSSQSMQNARISGWLQQNSLQESQNTISESTNRFSLKDSAAVRNEYLSSFSQQLRVERNGRKDAGHSVGKSHSMSSTSYHGEDRDFQEMLARKREYNRIKQREHRAKLTPQQKREMYERQKRLRELKRMEYSTTLDRL